MKKCSILLLLSMLSTVLSSCRSDDGVLPDSTKPTSYAKVVIAYIMAENSLSNLSLLDIREMETGSGDIPEDCRLITFIDNAGSPRIYEFSKWGKRTLWDFDTDFCSTDSAQMETLLSSIIQMYPAADYGLVLWSHGSGWIPQHTDFQTARRGKQRTIGIDNNKNNLSNTGKEMNIITLKHVLEHHPKMEFIYFDACYMQGIETAYELKDVTDYLIGSPAETPGHGAPYDKIMSDFFKRPLQPETLINKVYESYLHAGGILLSAVRCSELENLATATRPHIRELFAGKAEPGTSGVQAYAAYCSQTLYRPEFFDMNGFLFNHLDAETYETWKTQFDKTVIARAATPYWTSSISPYYFTPKLTDKEHYGGLSWFVPAEKYDPQGWNNDFRETAWYFEAGWASTGW